MVTAFATVVMALLLAPVNELAGPYGLGIVMLGSGIGAWALRRRIERIRAGS
jgi:hypothetical protein